MLIRGPLRRGSRYFSTQKPRTTLSEHTRRAKSADELGNELLEYSRSQKVVPQDALVKFYEHCRSGRDPFLAHIFVHLVPSSGQLWRAQNINRAIQLYIAIGQTENALAFFRSVQVANSGRLDITYETLEAVLLAAKYHKDVDICWQAVRAMNEIHEKVYSRDWGIFLSAALNAGDYAALQWIYKNAASPGLLTLDDDSFLRVAELASKNGDFMLCRWCITRLRRRQAAFKIQTDAASATTLLKMFIALIEAGSYPRHDQTVSHGSIKSACRYLVRLSSSAAQVRTRDLPIFISALADPEAEDYVEGIYEAMLHHEDANPHVKCLLLNVLLKSYMGRDKLEEAADLYEKARLYYVQLNEDSLLLLTELAILLRDDRYLDVVMLSDSELLTPKVLRHVQRGASALGAQQVYEAVRAQLEDAGVPSRDNMEN